MSRDRNTFYPPNRKCGAGLPNLHERSAVRILFAERLVTSRWGGRHHVGGVVFKLGVSAQGLEELAHSLCMVSLQAHAVPAVFLDCPKEEERARDSAQYRTNSVPRISHLYDPAGFLLCTFESIGTAQERKDGSFLPHRVKRRS